MRLILNFVFTDTILNETKSLSNHEMFVEIFIFNTCKQLFSNIKGEDCIRTEDIIEILRREGQSIALVMIGGIHYYTGQLFDIETITRVAHEEVCLNVCMKFDCFFLFSGLSGWLGFGACCRQCAIEIA